jgi:hypothetical protein
MVGAGLDVTDFSLLGWKADYRAGSGAVMGRAGSLAERHGGLCRRGQEGRDPDVVGAQLV